MEIYTVSLHDDSETYQFVKQEDAERFAKTKGESYFVDTAELVEDLGPVVTWYKIVAYKMTDNSVSRCEPDEELYFDFEMTAKIDPTAWQSTYSIAVMSRDLETAQRTLNDMIYKKWDM